MSVAAYQYGAFQELAFQETETYSAILQTRINARTTRTILIHARSSTPARQNARTDRTINITARIT